MNTNPYEAPREPAPRVKRRRRPGAASWILPWLLILFVSYALAAVVTPPDPFSSLLVAIPLFLAMIVARWSGVRAGRREVEERIEAERRDEA